MIESVEFQNFKVLRQTTLPLGKFTLMVGPNGSGKSTALQALNLVANPGAINFHQVSTAGLSEGDAVSLLLRWGTPHQGVMTRVRWVPGGYEGPTHTRSGSTLSISETQVLMTKVSGARIYSLDARAIAAPVRLEPGIHLRHDGGLLAGVLDLLRDRDPERFEALNEELGRWLHEFDHILFETPASGNRSVLLRAREKGHAIKAVDLSQGTLLALAILTLAYLPDPPSIVCFEEPDRGIHPRLLRDVRDALYRLSYPETFDEKREPTQVVATTHSPYFLELFKDHPEEIVIAKKDGLEASFERLSDLPDLRELLEDAHLGDVWYSGVLGGVPSDR